MTEFVCNICGLRNLQPEENLTREGVSCTGCESSVRTRAIVRMLIREISGADWRLDELPLLRGICGMGISDSRDYATRLGEKFTYRNTYYHKPPLFDITNVPDYEWASYDFLIASEVFEHVSPPVDTAFHNAWRLLKPGGIFLFTVPYVTEGATTEHFRDLYQYRVVDLEGKWVLVNRKASGEVEVFENLVFHGGGGSTLELRVFTEPDLRGLMTRAGFQSVEIYSGDLAPFGIRNQEKCSLPMVARKQPFSLSAAALGELFEQCIHARRELKETGDLYRSVYDWATKKVDEDATELAARAKWAQDLAAQLEERTRWARNLEIDVAHHVTLAERFAGANRDLVEENRKLNEQLSAATAMREKAWTKLGRKLGFVE